MNSCAPRQSVQCWARAGDRYGAVLAAASALGGMVCGAQPSVVRGVIHMVRLVERGQCLRAELALLNRIRRHAPDGARGDRCSERDVDAA